MILSPQSQYKKKGVFIKNIQRQRMYWIWAAMIQRCTNPNNSAYLNYGRRGINISQEWMNFKTFYKDMGNRPSGKTLERVDNNLGYSKDNCIWASRFFQSNNRRNNLRFIYKGKNLTLAEIARLEKIKYRALHARDDLLTAISHVHAAPKIKFHFYHYNGKRRTLAEIARLINILKQSLYYWIFKKKLSLEDAISRVKRRSRL